MEDRLQMLAQQLRTQGYRLTPQRTAIMEVVLGSHSHPTAEEIYDQVSADFPMVSLATVYKTLNVMKTLGTAVELSIDGLGHYDGNTVPHPHLVCVSCHQITDLPPDTMVQVPNEIWQQTGFCALWHEVKVYGLCSDCQ